MRCGIGTPRTVPLCHALCRRVHARHEISHRLDGLVAQPYLAPADEVHHGGDDVLIVLGHAAHHLDHIEKRQRTGSNRRYGLLCHRFMGVRRQVRHDPWKEHTTCHHVDKTSPLPISRTRSRYVRCRSGCSDTPRRIRESPHRVTRRCTG
jgi:hypothetical protein